MFLARAAFVVLLTFPSALALSPEQAASQEAFVAAVEARRDLLERVQGSYDASAKLFDAELRGGADQEALAAALVELQALQLDINGNWIFGSDARQNPELKPLISSYDELDTVLRYGGTLLPTAGVSPSGRATVLDANVALRRAVGPFLTLARKDVLLSTSENQALLDEVHKHVQAAAAIFEGLSEPDRKESPGGRALLKNILLIMTFVEETDAQWKAREQTSEADRATCQSLRDERKEGLWHLIQLGILEQTSGFNLNEAGIEAWLARNEADLAAADRFVAECNDPETLRVFAACYPDVHGESSLTHFYNDNDPEAWCHVASRARELLAAEVLTIAQQNGAIQSAAAKAFNEADGEGWIASDSLLSFSEMFSVTPERRKALIEPVRPLFEQLNLDDELLEAAFAPMAEEYARQAEAAKASAPGLTPMQGSSTFYGADLSRTQVGRVFPSARILRTSASPDWKVNKNVFGLPESRERGGWILFEVPGDPYCQERTFLALEPYEGSGYSTARAVGFGSVRWLACPTR